MAPATRARKSKKDASSAASLIEALKFISEAQHKNGQALYETHCYLNKGWAIAFDGILTIGHKIEEEITACPHTETLLAALLKCKEGINITQLDNGKLSIKSGKFKAMISCDTSGGLPTLSVGPDPSIATINDNLKRGFEVVGGLADTVRDKGVTDCSLIVRPGTVAATNRYVMLEYWHGLDLPPNMVVPKIATQVIAKTDKKLVGFGYSGSTATFHFEDESYIKTQLIIEEWPLYERMFENPKINAWPIPANFWEAVNTLIPFAEQTPILYFDKGLMKTSQETENASVFEVDGLPPGLAFNGNYLKLVEHCAQKIDFGLPVNSGAANAGKAYVFGENVRGVIMGVRIK